MFIFLELQPVFDCDTQTHTALHSSEAVMELERK